MIKHPDRSILGPVPDEWDVVPLGELLSRSSSGDWGDDRGELALPVLRSTNFTMDRLIDFSDVTPRGFSETQAERFDIRCGDLLIERSGGGPNQPVGRVVVVEDDLPRHGFSNFLQLLRIDSAKADADYVAWCLFRLHQSGIVERLQHQTTQMRNLDFRDYLTARLPYPTRNEQERVAETLSTTHQAVRSVGAQLFAARTARRALRGELFTRGLPGRHRRFLQGKFGRAPQGWDVVPLRTLGSLRSGGTPDRSRPDFYVGGVPWVKSGEVRDTAILATSEHISENAARQIGGTFPPGTLLIAMYGAGVTRGKVGILGIDAAINQAVCAFSSYGRVLDEYLFYWFQHYYPRVRSFAGGANQGNLSAFLLGRLPIAVPDEDEQKKIVGLMRAADEAEAAISEKARRLRALHRSLLHHLLTGRVRVSEAVAA